MSTNAFGQPVHDETPEQAAETMDASMSLDDWLKGAALPQRKEIIYLDGPTYAEYEDLVEEAQRIRAAKPAEESPTADESLGAEPYDARLQEVADRLEDALERLRPSGKTIIVRALSDDQQREVVKKHPVSDKDDVEAERIQQRIYERVAMAVVRPVFSPQEWHKIRNRIGDVQFGRIVNAMMQVNLTGAVTPDFSLPASVTAPTEESSTS